MVVLDTCAVIETCKLKLTFSESTKRCLDSGAYILSASFAEIACKIKIGRLDIGISTQELHEKIKQIPAIEIVSIDVTEWLDAVALEWQENKDPVDRLITAFARKKDIAIVTTDTKIKNFYNNVIW